MSLKTILKNFLNHVDTLEAQRKIGNDLYEVDFQKLKALTEQLKHDKDYATKEGLKDVNRRKNRYKDILPYDCSRVILSDYPGVPGSDYINANYIKGASGSLAYIASQGPLPNTVVDFWRMIWECEVQVIVMACNEQESGKYKCECYWPGEDDKKQYGNINVEMVKWRQVCPDFLVRTLKACYEDEERVLCQFHYTTWPDHGVPNSVQPILELVRLIRDCQASEAVPVLVHCSAGCGRTGTICAIDYVWGLMRMGKLTKTFNLFNVISDMRRQRIAMVQTKEQYVLVHKAVSSLFEQQLRVIDSHTYENLDEDGEPLILKELPPEESLYEDILDPDMYDKAYRPVDVSFENESCLKHHDYRIIGAVDVESLSSASRYEGLEKSPLSGKNAANLNVSSAYVNKSEHDAVNIMDLSVITAHDCQVSAVAEQILSDSDRKDSTGLPASKSSTVLLKLHREESVKRLISGWNKATQNLEAPKTVAKINQMDKNESSVADSSKTSNVSNKEQDHSKNTIGKESLPKSECSMEKYSIYQPDSENSKSSEKSCDTRRHELESNSFGNSHVRSQTEGTSCKRSTNDESQHNGKLVGKATVIRRPSIAKLKALFEKSSTSDQEHAAEESTRRRRPLFRSHSHYVGHSRTFSVPDSSHSSASPPLNVTSINSVHHSSGSDLVNTTRNLNFLQAQSKAHVYAVSDYNSQCTVTRRAPSPDKLIYQNYDDVFHENSVVKDHENREILQSQNELRLETEKEMRKIECASAYTHAFENDETLGQQYKKTPAGIQFSYTNFAVPGDAFFNNREFPLSKGKDARHVVPVHLRVKQYTSSAFQEKPPNLPVKKRKEFVNEPVPVVNDARACENSLSSSSPNFTVDGNTKPKLIASKSEDYLTTPKTMFQPDTYNSVAAHCKENDCEDKLNSSKMLSSSLNESTVLQNSLKNLQDKNNMTKDINIHSTRNDVPIKPNNRDELPFENVSKAASNIMYDSNTKAVLTAKLSNHGGSANSHREIKYTNINPLSHKNLQQIEEKLKNHPRGAIIDLTSRKSYIDDTQGIYEKPPLFLSTNQPVKMQQPMESQVLKSPERLGNSSSSFSKPVDKLPISQNSAVPKSKKPSKILNQDANPKNLLLHSPPPKSKRNHSSKNISNSIPNQMESKMPEPLPESDKRDINTGISSDSQANSVHSGSSKSADSDKHSRFVPLSAASPTSRSDPRYFPVTRQTAEDARYASELQKSDEVKKVPVQKYENRPNFFTYMSSAISDSKSTAIPNPHQSKNLISDISDSRTEHSKSAPPFVKYESNSSHPAKVNEEIYGVHRSKSGHVPVIGTNEGVSNYKESNNKMNPQSLYDDIYGQRPQNVTAPNAYPPGPPKPPRTFNHKYKHFFDEHEDSGQHEKLRNFPSQEGGRYIVSVASPKQTSENNSQETNVRPSSSYRYINNVTNPPDKVESNHQSQIYGTVQSEFMSRSYPFPSHSSASSSSTKFSESQYAEIPPHRNFRGPEVDHIYHTVREKPNHEPLYGAIKNKNHLADYENLYDNPRKYADTVTSNVRQGVEQYNYMQNPNSEMTHTLQYSQSDAGLYAVLQNQNPVTQLSYNSNGGIEDGGDVTAVPKRVYFDTLQRRHKQQVSWEQRRSHDDMDIRPAPSARLKEQIHARRSMVELDNLEISVATDNGFYEHIAPHSTLSRKEFSQDTSNFNGRSSHKRTPIEFSDSLLTKEVHPRKGGSHSKESGSFSGTLYKAFGKLTSLTKFNKEPSNRNTAEDHNAKAPLCGSKEEKKHTNVPHWSPRKSSDQQQQQEPSEQWTEV